ncbi:MAG: N-acetylgalactosamine-6-sulfatase [Planctomycetes bacterium B3_Pla]|nr:MAG: N-acetylgalactosamine-6-sulfatase [Planctomycetes bacterium B3_Pla]
MGIAAASAGVSSLLPGSATAGRSNGPNIIYVLADDLGYGDLGCYGQKTIKTPNIDKLAEEGMKFTDHYAGSTVCAPSRCCLMTGLHTGHALVRANGNVPLRPSDVTVAELLKDAGYSTGIIGKWGLGEAGSTGIPNRQGFDYWFGYLNQRHAHNYYPTYLWRNEEKVPLKNEVNHVIGGRDRTPGGVATRRVEYSHDLFAEEALGFVEQNKDRPFFLYLPFTIPHANNEAGGKGMEVPSFGPYSDKEWPDPQKGHAAMITRMDSDVGRLMAKLKKLGLDENTLVMFSSDNGPHKEGGGDPAFFNASGPLKGYKRALYEGGIRVPMIARWPDRIKAGSVSDHISAFWDFLPTCCELVGVEAPDGIDGISMVPTLLGQSRRQKKHEVLYWEFHEQGKKLAVRMGNWKGIRLNVAKKPDGPIELYNLKDDIGEKNNLAGRHPEIAAKIAGHMKTARTPSEHWRMPGE